MYRNVYLDTCIVSGLAKEDLHAEDQEALWKLLELHKKGQVKLVTSALTREELSQIPTVARRRHEMIYNLLSDVPLSGSTWLDSDLTLTRVGGGIKEDPLYTRLKDILPDKNDAQHIFHALRNECPYFVTTDKRTILRHSTKMFLQFDELMVMSPSEIIVLLLEPV